jgi:hypothetical protein
VKGEEFPTPLPGSQPLNLVDSLGALCRAQQVRIASLCDELQRCYVANRQLSEELLDATEQRADAVLQLTAQVRRSGELTDRAVKERDVVIEALRKLVAVVWTSTGGTLSVPDVPAWVRAYHEADELLKVIDLHQTMRPKADE